MKPIPKGWRVLRKDELVNDTDKKLYTWRGGYFRHSGILTGMRYDPDFPDKHDGHGTIIRRIAKKAGGKRK